MDTKTAPGLVRTWRKLNLWTPAFLWKLF